MTESTPMRRPPLLVAVVAAVTLQAGLLVGVGVYYLVTVLGGDGTEAGAVGATAAFALVAGVALAFFARGLWARRRWSRAPIVTWNLLVVFSLLSTRAWSNPLGLALILLAVATVAATVSRPVTAATASEADPPVT